MSVNLSEWVEIEVTGWLEVLNRAILSRLVPPGRLCRTLRCIDFKLACSDENLAANMASSAVRNGAFWRMNAALSAFAASITLVRGILSSLIEAGRTKLGLLCDDTIHGQC
jgi:hypothetical protein